MNWGGGRKETKQKGKLEKTISEPHITRPRLKQTHTGRTILIGFAMLVALFGTVTLLHYWDMIMRNQDSLYFSAWLFLFMIAGMFVQVMAFNYRTGRGLFNITASQLIFPVLFSIVVFYPIWAIAASASHSFFSVHAAFLNGYFWESVVSTASPVTAPGQA